MLTHNRILAFVALIGGAMLACTSTASAQCYADETAKLMSPGTRQINRFGWSVAVSADVALIGALSGYEPGAGYVFRHNGLRWAHEATLLPQSFSVFGWALGISGDVGVVGAYADSTMATSAGCVYVFHYDGNKWVEQPRLYASDAGYKDRFGWSVAVDGDVLVVGADLKEFGSVTPDAGAAYVFRYKGDKWVQEVKLPPPAGVASHRFGKAVAVCEKTAVIADNSLAYVFEYDGEKWTEEAQLSGGGLIGPVSISGNTILIGIPLAHGQRGEVHVFRHEGGNWNHEATLVAFDGAEQDCFGLSVGISGNLIVVGAYQDDDKGPNSGSAYVFRRHASSWVAEAKLLASEGDPYDQLGRSVAVSDGTAFVGAPWDEEKGSLAGGAYVFAGLSDCNTNGVLDLCDISEGTSTDYNGNGIPDECEGLGDLNCDGIVNFDDIDPFVLALSDPTGYEKKYPGCPFTTRDINGDDKFDFDDIDPFVALLSP